MQQQNNFPNNIMAPRSVYILPQESQYEMYISDNKDSQDHIDLNNEENQGTISLFKPRSPNADLLDIGDVIENDDEVQNDKNVQRAPINNCSCHKPRVRRSLLPELELEAIRLSPAGPWLTLSRSQNKRSRSQRRKLNDPVKQRLFI